MCRSRSWLRRRRTTEIYLWCLARTLLSLEIGIVAREARKTGYDIIREQTDVRVVVLHSLVIAAALNCDAILGSGQLIL